MLLLSLSASRIQPISTFTSLVYKSIVSSLLRYYIFRHSFSLYRLRLNDLDSSSSITIAELGLSYTYI